jgi:spore coat protein CotH
MGPGFRGSGPGGPGGPGGMQQKTKLVQQFDKDGDGHLNAAERKAAREYLTSGAAGGRGRRGPGGPGGRGGRGGNQASPIPGPKVSPAGVKSFPGVPLYDPLAVRTFFLEFEETDWEKELADFKNTDVEVPAKLTVDGRTYRDVGVHFHGMSSYMMVGEGQKRSLVLTLDFVHPDQRLEGYRKLDLLNSHEDPSFLRTVLAMQIARDYMPAPKANFVQVVINGESWGLYVNQQHFNKDFVRDWFGTTKGARWKVPGSPDGRGGMNYLGADAAAYKRIYEIKSKDNPESWADLIKLCKVLNETPADQLEQALAPLLDIDGALRFFAWENVLANGDGFYTRASDYDIYEDKTGRFHIIPYDANETFSTGGGPGGPGGPGGFGPGGLVAPQLLAQADKNGDQKLVREEFTALADAWFDKLDPDKTDKVSQEQFTAKLGEVLPLPQGFGPRGGGAPGEAQRPGRGRGGFGPAMFLGPGLFTAVDADKDGSLTRAELKDTFGKWFGEWDTDKSGALDEDKLRNGLSAALPPPNFGGPGGGRGRGGPGFGGGPGGGGIQLDPLVAANDANKPLLSKLLAVPSLRARYLGYVRDIAEKWLDWNKLGPIAQQYHALIAADVKIDTRKVDSTEAFLSSISENTQGQATVGGFGGGRSSNLKSFAEKRRAFLLNYDGLKKGGN